MKYFAYGSNMLTRRLKAPSRAPSAVARGVATIAGFAVRFHKVSADGSGKCTLLASEDDSAVAYGVLYELADADADRLDRVEGVHTGGYSRCSVRLRLLDGRTTDAETYVAGDRYIDPARVPFDWYRDLVVAGAVEHGLPQAYIEELAHVPVASDPDTLRVAAARRLLEG